MSDHATLTDQIADELKDAMRAKDKVRLRTLRSLRSALLEKEISKREDGTRTELSEQEELAVVRKQAKQRQESIEQYQDAGRDDLVDKEQQELDVLQEYLPDPLTDDELRERLETIIEEVGASSMADMGPVMGKAMDQLRGRVDGSRVQQHVKDLLMD
jgi:hypothetical protein